MGLTARASMPVTHIYVNRLAALWERAVGGWEWEAGSPAAIFNSMSHLYSSWHVQAYGGVFQHTLRREHWPAPGGIGALLSFKKVIADGVRPKYSPIRSMLVNAGNLRALGLLLFHSNRTIDMGVRYYARTPP